MNVRLPKYVPLFLVSAFAVISCGETQPVSPTAPGPVDKAMITAEPATVSPEFLPTPFCPRFSPFGARFALVVRPGQDLILRVVQFQFVDRFGGRTFPSVIPLDTTAFPPSSLPGSPPIPTPTPSTLPSSGPVPIPSSPFSPLLIPAGTFREFPFLLQFGCGVPAEGTVVVSLEFTDRRGTAESSELRVRIQG